MGHVFLRVAAIAGLMVTAWLGPLGGAALAQQNLQWRHGVSLFGALKYPDGFTNFDYVNPNAPKGGKLRRAALGTFDTLNPFNLKGTSATGSGLIYETLLSSAMDEASSEYGLLADAVSFPADFSSVTYRLRSQARWHDGRPVTPEDVIFSLEMLKKAHPRYKFYYKNVVKAEKTGENQVTFRFDQKGNRELPQITGQLVILPQHFWTGTNAKGEPRDFLASTLEPPLGSGPYRIGEVKPGRTITYERVPDYWGADLPVRKGTNNFDQLVYEYFRDSTVLLEAFKGDAYDFTVENSSKRWATGYKFPAVTRKNVVLQEFVTKNAEPMQAYVFNTRRAKFADARVRHAFDLAFDFEWLNKNVFFSQYKRTTSYFENSELKATGLPEGAELAILEKVRALVPPEVFTKPYETPVNGSRANLRANLRKARALLAEAGWVIMDQELRNAKTGEPMEVEFLTVQPDSERILNPYRKNLDRLGIKSSIRYVDVSQYRQRLDNFEFDIVTSVIAQSLSPGNEQRDMWGSATADRTGSRNLIGIKNPGIDKIIDAIIFAKDRAELVAATHALDRVLLWNRYVVPQFFSPLIRTARWDRFGLPKIVPDYGISVLSWWYDTQKAAKIRDGK
ncbi:MAG: extracellular solute-binding protein [Alphaproteobacteria bacterium]